MFNYYTLNEHRKMVHWINDICVCRGGREGAGREKDNARGLTSGSGEERQKGKGNTASQSARREKGRMGQGEGQEEN